MKAEAAGSSISNQNIHNVDSIEILPIFHKLLEDKRSSDCAFNHSSTQDSSSHYPHHKTSAAATSENHHSKNRFHSARSCPDMSVRCDIVEYLWGDDGYVFFWTPHTKTSFCGRIILLQRSSSTCDTHVTQTLMQLSSLCVVSTVLVPGLRRVSWRVIFVMLIQTFWIILQR